MPNYGFIDSNTKHIVKGNGLVLGLTNGSVHIGLTTVNSISEVRGSPSYYGKSVGTGGGGGSNTMGNLTVGLTTEDAYTGVEAKIIADDKTIYAIKY